MIVLYTGIYRVALDLHRRSEEKRRKQATSLAAMAQHTVSHLGTAVIGVTRTAKMDAHLIQQQQQQQHQLQMQRQQVMNQPGLIVLSTPPTIYHHRLIEAYVSPTVRPMIYFS